jgi:hypothetical protein
MNELRVCSKAEQIAHEVFSSVRTVFSLNGGKFEQRRCAMHSFSTPLEGHTAMMLSFLLYTDMKENWMRLVGVKYERVVCMGYSSVGQFS